MEKKRIVRLAYGIFLSVLTVAVGVIFLAEVADIYFSEGRFTREIVGERLLPALVPFCIWIAAIVAGFVLSVVYPLAEKKRKPNAFRTYRRLYRKIPKGSGTEFEAELARVQGAEKVRIILWAVCAAVCAAGGIFSAVYVFNHTHFPADDLNGEMLEMAKRVLPCVAISFLCCIGTVVYEWLSARELLPSVKKLIALGGGAAKEHSAEINDEKYIVLSVRIVLAVIAVTFIIWGVLNGGVADVLIKAINICTECIGLG